MSNGSGRSGKAGGTRRRVRARPAPVPSASRGRKRPPNPHPAPPPQLPHPWSRHFLEGLQGADHASGNAPGKGTNLGWPSPASAGNPPSDWAGVPRAGGDSAKRGCFHIVLCCSPQSLYFLFKKKITKNSTQESITFFFSSECYSTNSPYH